MNVYPVDTLELFPSIPDSEKEMMDATVFGTFDRLALKALNLTHQTFDSG